MKLIRLILPLMMIAAAAPRAAHAAQPADTPTRIEVLGLRKWTVPMLESAVAKYAPGMTLADAACAVILRDSVGFPDAMTFTVTDESGTRWRVLAVIEPEASEYVRFVPTTGEFPQPRVWDDVFAALGPDFHALNRFEGEVLLSESDTADGRALPDSVIALRETVRRHSSEMDWELARYTLLNDSNWRNRTVASLVLSNFGDRDATLYLLVEGLRWPDGTASHTSYTVLSGLVRKRSVPVDWTPARDALAALTGGTGLGMLPRVLTLLIDSRIDQRLGSDLARVNPELLLDHLHADNPLSPIAVHNFLQYVSGFQASTDNDVWEDFLYQVSGPSSQESL